MRMLTDCTASQNRDIYSSLGQEWHNQIGECRIRVPELLRATPIPEGFISDVCFNHGRLRMHCGMMPSLVLRCLHVCLCIECLDKQLRCQVYWCPVCSATIVDKEHLPWSRWVGCIWFLTKLELTGCVRQVLTIPTRFLFNKWKSVSMIS